jgi:excisionase family DNA binding protein
MARLYRVDDVAQQLRLGRATVYRLIARGVLPTVKIGRSRRVAEEDLRAFIEALRAEQRSNESSFEQE